MFKLEIRTGGAAFRDEDDNLDTTNTEIIKLLKGVMVKLEQGYDGGKLMDTNGNSVGSWSLE